MAWNLAMFLSSVVEFHVLNSLLMRFFLPSAWQKMLEVVWECQFEFDSSYILLEAVIFSYLLFLYAAGSHLC